MTPKLTTEGFVEKAIKIHGDKYDYSKVNYINSHTKVCIICKIHGEFLQKPSGHTSGKGCRKCSGSYSYSNKEWIEEAERIHDNKYDYSKVNYTKAHDKVIIICNTHGEFQQQANLHLTGSGCQKCGVINRSMIRIKTTKEWIEEAKSVHGDKYDYSKVNYTKARDKVIIICKTIS